MVGFPKYWMSFLEDTKKNKKINKTKKKLEQSTTKGFINMQFLQKLSCQKPFWDEARPSSVINIKFLSFYHSGYTST